MANNKKAENNNIFGIIITVILIWGLIGMFATMNQGNTCNMGLLFLCFSWERNTLGHMSDFFDAQSPEMKENIEKTLDYIENPQKRIEDTKKLTEQNQINFEKDNAECISKANKLMPSKLTLAQESFYFFYGLDNPDVHVEIRSCNVRKGSLTGENVNEFYGGCDFSYQSKQLISKSGEILGQISFSGHFDKLSYIENTDRTRQLSNYPALNLKNFNIDKLSFYSCDWINIDDSEVDCSSECGDLCTEKGLESSKSTFVDGACKCDCIKTCDELCKKGCEDAGQKFVSSETRGSECDCNCII